ncbi:MAG TPA: hypothetical protein VIL99_09535 [Ignavibacteria bacterium]
MEGSVIKVLFLIFVINFVIFLAIRYFMLWYWRVNEIVSLLEKIKDELANLNPSVKSINKKPEDITYVNPLIKRINDTLVDICCPYCGNWISIEKKIIDAGEFNCPKCQHEINYKT